MDKNLRIEIQSDPRMLRAIRGLVRGYLESLEYSESCVSSIVLAVDEACANAMRHSYQGDLTQRLTLRLSSDANGVEIMLRDQGSPAEVETMMKNVNPNTSCVRKLKPGGLGVRIMCEAFDEIIFRPGKKRGNCVTMRLNRPGGRVNHDVTD